MDRKWLVIAGLVIALLVAALAGMEHLADRHPGSEPPVAASPALEPAPSPVPESTEAEPSSNPALMR